MEPVQPRLQSAANDNSNMERMDEQFELTLAEADAGECEIEAASSLFWPG